MMVGTFPNVTKNRFLLVIRVDALRHEINLRNSGPSTKRNTGLQTAGEKTRELTLRNFRYESLRRNPSFAASYTPSLPTHPEKVFSQLFL